MYENAEKMYFDPLLGVQFPESWPKYTTLKSIHERVK